MDLQCTIYFIKSLVKYFRYFASAKIFWTYFISSKDKKLSQTPLKFFILVFYGLISFKICQLKAKSALFLSSYFLLLLFQQVS